MPPLDLKLAQSAGPSSAADTGGTRDVGAMTVGYYYASGSRVRGNTGWAWPELAVMGVALAVGVYLWRK